VTTYDLIIIGTGSGNSVITPDFDNWKIAIVEKGVFGGTCLNRGCIPSKMLVHVADTVTQIEHSQKLGINAQVTEVRWEDIKKRIFKRIDLIAENGRNYRVELPNVDVYQGQAKFTGSMSIDIDGTEIHGKQIVVATGATPQIPPINGLKTCGYQTSDSIMRIDAVPERLTIIGGGYIATEMAHIFSGLGADVTMLVRGSTLLRNEDREISQRFTEVFKSRVTLYLDTTVDRLSRDEKNNLTIRCQSPQGYFNVDTDELLVATGRIPTTSDLDPESAGIQMDEGYIVTDEYMRTNIPHIWALGDVTNPHQLKHTANAEARAVAHNLAHPHSLIPVDLDPIPHAVFSNPQVASVGLTEQELESLNVQYIAVLQEYSGIAYGWALEDNTSFCKLLVHPLSAELLGAHIIGPQASTLIHQLIQGIRFKQTVHELSSDFLYIHPAMNEVIENALLKASAMCRENQIMTT
jgi:mycothione reductase